MCSLNANLSKYAATDKTRYQSGVRLTFLQGAAPFIFSADPKYNSTKKENTLKEIQ
jgi:hypothetical protein